MAVFNTETETELENRAVLIKTFLSCWLGVTVYVSCSCYHLLVWICYRTITTPGNMQRFTAGVTVCMHVCTCVCVYTIVYCPCV